MPFIQELDQQKAALVRINRNLSEVKKVNSCISTLNELNMHAPDVKASIEIAYEDGDSFGRIKCPILLEDFAFILRSAGSYKRSIVERINEDSEQFRISLTPEEKTLIEMKPIVSES